MRQTTMATSKIGMCKQCARAFEYETETMPDKCGDCNTVYLE